MQKTPIFSTLAALLCAATAAHAQTTAPAPPPAQNTSPPTASADAPAPKPITIKLGAFFPSSGNLKDIVDKTFFAAGAEYAFVNKENASPVTPLVYLDYIGRSKNRSVDDGQGNSVSLDVTASTVGLGGGVRYSFGAPEAGSVTPYVGAGLGVYFNRVKAGLNVASGGQSASVSDSANKTQLGFRLNAGLEFQRTYLLEANYTNAGKIGETRIDGFGVQVGARF